MIRLDPSVKAFSYRNDIVITIFKEVDRIYKGDIPLRLRIPEAFVVILHQRFPFIYIYAKYMLHSFRVAVLGSDFSKRIKEDIVKIPVLYCRGKQWKMRICEAEMVSLCSCIFNPV